MKPKLCPIVLVLVTLFSCRKDTEKPFEGVYNCNYHSKTWLEGYPQSYHDTTYYYTVELEQTREDQIEITGDVYVNLVFVNDTYELFEDVEYNGWSGKFTSDTTFELGRGSFYWGHHSSHALECTKK